MPTAYVPLLKSCSSKPRPNLDDHSYNLLRRLGMNLVRAEEVEFKGESCIEQTFELRREDWLLHKTG